MAKSVDTDQMMHCVVSNLPASMALLDVHPTGDQEVAGSIPTKSGNILLLGLIMKYLRWSFSPFS